MDESFFSIRSIILKTITHIRDVYIGYKCIRTICRKYGINPFRDYVLVLSNEAKNISKEMLLHLDWMLGHDGDSAGKDVLVITDDEELVDSACNYSDRISAIHYEESVLIRKIITSYSMYRSSCRMYVGMLEPLQGRGRIEWLERVGINVEDIVKYGIYEVGWGANIDKGFFSLTFQYAIAGVYSFIGEIVYRRVISECSDKKIRMFIYEYSGVGDVYVFSAYLKKVIKGLSDVSACLVVSSKACATVARMCGIDDVQVITIRQMKMLVYYARVARFDDNDIVVMTPFPKRLSTDIYSHYLYGKRINMAEAYWCILLGLNSGEFEYPIIYKNDAYINKLFEMNGLRKGKTVILSPYANTINCFPERFWERLTKILIDRDFDVCTNASNNEAGIKGTKKIWFDLEHAEHVVNTAGFFIGIRSGFCDIVCGGTGRKVVLYPEYEIFNSTVYDFCSFEKMGIGRNITEIRWDFENFDVLADKVADAIM